MDELLWSFVCRSPRADEIRLSEVLVRMNMGRTKLLDLSSSSYIPCLSIGFLLPSWTTYLDDIGLDFPCAIRAYIRSLFIYVFVVYSIVLSYCYYGVIMDKVMDLLVCTYLLIRH